MKEVIIIILNERCTQILIKLLNSSLPVKITELASSFKVSSRTIRYDLDEIDEFLKYNNLPQLIRKPNVGVKFSESLEDKNKALELLDDVSIYYYALSQKERVNIILSNLIGQKDYTTINALADNLMVSRSTIINDLSKVRKWLYDHGLELKSVPKYGLKVLGDEKKLRKAAIELLTETVDIDRALDIVKSPIYTRINVGMDNEIKKLFENIDLSYIEDCIKTAESELETVFSDAAFTGLVIHIAITIKRIELGRDIVMPTDELKSLEMTKEFSVASNIAKMLEEHFKVNIPIDEIGYITVHLLGSSVTNKKNNKEENWLELELMTKKIINNVEKEVNIDLSKDGQLFEGLLEHVRPTIYRLSHGLDLKNPVLDEIKRNYSKLFEIVKRGLRPLEEYAGNRLNDEEVGYFVMHFGAAIERQKASSSGKMDVLVVCGTGIGTAKMLSSRLQSVFNVNIKGTVAYHQVKDQLKKKHVDLIVSTVPVEAEGIKTVVVNPLLTENDIEKLKLFIRNDRTYAIKLDDLIEIIEKHCSILNRQKLIEELKEFLDLEDVNEERGVAEPLLKDLLTEKTIRLNVEVKDWEEAVRIGGELLEKEGAIEHRYIDAMIDSVKEIGPYIVIAPGIAMPHARPESGAKKIGMSLITLKNPVNFGNKENDPVKIVVCLCAVDHSSHLKALSELVELLGDDEKVQKIKFADDIYDVVNLIINGGITECK
ncbi:BglG family transcription antiterminator [Thermoanaerobacterium butyriciformans]|uniref:Transcriptional antiterminator/mannitol/fructose-specific phosphotransferase system IIA component (Ntr-type) n=1 Tax=Thermoanaerobacterium butyriciformans TaxID=1702242 RepID=A0ABS4NFJ2_9THEO|nr:BglG family transcription antiterminator [Thermoanaerobacterium butyriciformans]MBP2072433.1 transcriptional antiterminator/mannitol/fructose-specific phosphotransferase system IIA component (Ntr-type) [Thermoanaerobacterium butyriciformans]